MGSFRKNINPYLIVCNIIFIIFSVCPGQTIDPRLHPASNERWLIVWQSDLNKNLFTAQFLNSDGTLEGNNFSIKSNELIAFNAVSDFMVTKTFNYPGNEYINSSFDVNGWIYSSLMDTTDSFFLTRHEWPFCGTGFLGFEELLFGLNQNFIYVFQFNGQPGCKIFDNSGVNISDNHGTNTAINITSDGLPDNSFLIIWFGGYYDYENNSQTPGIYATLFNQNEVAEDSILIKEYSLFPEELSEPDPSKAPKLKVKAFTDSTYCLFVLEPDSMLLYCYLLNRDVEILKRTKTALPILYQYSPSEIPEIKIFNISNLVENSLSVFISSYTYTYPDRHITNYLYYFSEEEFEFLNAEIDTTQNFKADCFKFKISSNEFINPAKNNNEIQIEFFQNFTFNKSLTIARVNSIDKDESFIYPSQIYLSQNYPNPFNPSTTIEYGLPENGEVRILIYDVQGNQIKELLNKNQKAGFHQSVWDGRNDNGQKVGSGIYYYQLLMHQYSSVKKMVYLK